MKEEKPKIYTKNGEMQAYRHTVGTSSQLSAISKIDLGIGIEKQLAVMNACTYPRARASRKCNTFRTPT